MLFSISSIVISALIRNRKYYTDKTYPYLMPVEKSVDIDSPLDFEIAECILRNRML